MPNWDGLQAMWWRRNWREKMSLQKHLYCFVSCLGIHLEPTLWNPRLLYTIEYHGPWLTFNFCVISAIDLCMFDNHNSCFFQFVITGWCCVASPVLCISHTCVAFCEDFCRLGWSPLRNCCSHTAYVNLCEFRHLELLPTKNVPHISVFQWYKQNDAQPWC